MSEIKLTDLERTFRIDSEFYSKINLTVQNKLKKISSKSIKNFLSVSDGNHMSIKEFFIETGIPYYRGGDIYNFFIEQTQNPLNIPKKVYDWNNMKRSHLKKGDVLISIVGAIIGNLSLVKTDQEATCSCKLAILRPKNISPELVAIFLKSKFGNSQIQKFRRGTGQTGFILEDFDQIIIPEFGVKFSSLIKEMVDDSFICLESSKNGYSQAEDILLEAVEFKDIESNKEPINVKSFKNSFLTTGRLDAEYYQPKFEQLVNHIIKQKHDTLSNLVTITKSIEPGSNHYSDEDGLPFYRVSDFNKFGLSNPDKKLTDSFVKSNETLLNSLKPKKGTILFSKDGSVGSAFLLRENLPGVTSSAILQLQIKNKKQIIPEYLSLALNSKLVQMQAERDAGGSIILHWRKEEIEKVLVPIIDYSIQQQIAELVEESFRLKVESEGLLELAMQAVEIAIEQNEKEAIDFINLKNIING